MDERTLREIYFPAFKAAVKEGGALNIMGAYNRLNGTYMCHNQHLIDDILRGEWGFQGFTLSDFANGIKSTADAVNARMNVEMHRPKFYGAPLVDEVKDGNIDESQIDMLLKDVLKVMYTMELFGRERYENPGVVHSKEHIQLTRKVAQSSPVLLKNNGQLLPINKKKVGSIAVIGPNAKRFPSVSEKHTNYSYYLQGGGSGRTYYFHNVLVEPFTGLANGVDRSINVAFAQGCETPDLYQDTAPPMENSKDQELIATAVELAKQKDMAVVYVGLSGFNETEGQDRVSSSLPGYQNQLIREVARVNPNTVVVLISGSYVDVSPWIDEVEALLYVPYNGEQIGNGIADILTGKTNPSGKLPFTWCSNVKDYPENAFFKGGPYSEEGKSNVYTEGIYVGYRWFDKENLKVQYPFGFGLSYTNFSYEKLEVIDKEAWPKTIKVKLRNEGEVSGEEVVQLYVRDMETSVERPIKELKGFAKMKLAPKEVKEVTLELRENDFSFFHPESKKWVMEDGNFEILVGSSSRDIQLREEITL